MIKDLISRRLEVLTLTFKNNFLFLVYKSIILVSNFCVRSTRSPEDEQLYANIVGNRDEYEMKENKLPVHNGILQTKRNSTSRWVTLLVQSTILK